MSCGVLAGTPLFFLYRSDKNGPKIKIHKDCFSYTEVTQET